MLHGEVRFALTGERIFALPEEHIYRLPMENIIRAITGLPSLAERGSEPTIYRATDQDLRPASASGPHQDTNLTCHSGILVLGRTATTSLKAPERGHHRSLCVSC